MKITISSTESSTIHISYPIGDRYKHYSLSLRGIKNPAHYLTVWLISKSRHLFLAMPLEAPSLAINKKLYDKFPDQFRAYIDILNNTNRYIQNIDSGSSISHSSKSSVLVFKTDNQRYNNLFAYVSKCYPGLVHNLHEPHNFDGRTRTFIDRPLEYSVSFLVDFILSNDISVVVSVNLDPLIRYFFAEKINIFAVLHFLGVKLVHLQNDPSELAEHGYLLRELSNYDSTEFLIHSILSQSFDRKSLGKTFPSPILQDYSQACESFTADIDTDYEVVVISNSRFSSTIANKSSFLPVLEQLENPLVELPLWYLSVCKVLDGDNTFSSSELTSRRHQFHWIFYHAAQYLKFNIVNSVSSSINLSVFGDAGWNSVCPDRYKGFLGLDELKPLYRNPKTLVLLLNFGYTYLDHSGPVYDVIRHGSNWINVPVIASTPELSGLSHLEYSDYSQLNHMLSNYTSYRLKAEDSKIRLRSLYQSSTDQFVDSLSTPACELAKSSFESSHDDHSRLLDLSISSYLSKNISSIMNAVYS